MRSRLYRRILPVTLSKASQCLCVIHNTGQHAVQTSESSACAANSQRQVALCVATPEIAEHASEEADWEETGRSRATSAATHAPC